MGSNSSDRDAQHLPHPSNLYQLDSKYAIILSINGNSGGAYQQKMDSYFRIGHHLRDTQLKFAEPVNVVSGSEEHRPSPDMIVSNPAGMAVSYQRFYSNTIEQAGYYTPGLSEGWLHSYDYYISENPPQTGVWGNLICCTPDGCGEIFTPTLVNGVPDGTFTAPIGTGYRLMGKPNLANPGNLYALVLITPSQTTFNFSRSPASANDRFSGQPDATANTTYYQLDKMIDKHRHYLVFKWDDSRRLQYIVNEQQSLVGKVYGYTT